MLAVWRVQSQFRHLVKSHKFMEITNEKLSEAQGKFNKMSNKELTESILGIKHEHEVVKAYIVELTNLLDELEHVYNDGYSQLNSRLNFEPTVENEEQ